MSLTLYATRGGFVVLPDSGSLLCSRDDGGNLVVNPPRDVWERSELTAEELTAWSFLVAATGRAMLDTLSQLEGGCINYWEAGNWALNDAADPAGRKIARLHRRVHLHLLGRSPAATNPRWRWGEAPSFPDYADRLSAASTYKRLTPDECTRIVEALDARLAAHYGIDARDRRPWVRCDGCGYPTTTEPGARAFCSECSRA